MWPFEFRIWWYSLFNEPWTIVSFGAFLESVKDALARLGAMCFDFLINNAGNNHHNVLFDKATGEEFDSVCNVHFKGVFFLTQKLLPLISDRGRTVNISTVRTRLISPGGAVYASMKGAVVVLSRHIARNLGRDGLPSTLRLRERRRLTLAVASSATILK